MVALDGLLRMCYPMEDPVFDSPRDAEGALAAAIKYDMGGIVARGCAQLQARCVPERPSDVLDVFVVASRLGLHGVAEKAARASLHQAFGRTLPEELKGASREAIFQLLDYRRRVQAAAVAIIMNPRSWTFYRMFGPLGVGGEDEQLTISDWGFPWSVGHWAILPMAYCKDGDLGCPPYVDDPQGLPAHIRIDRPEVFSDIHSQLEELPPLPESLDTPEVLLREVLTKANCNDCRINALKYFRRFFAELRDTIVTGALLDVSSRAHKVLRQTICLIANAVKGGIRIRRHGGLTRIQLMVLCEDTGPVLTRTT